MRLPWPARRPLQRAVGRSVPEPVIAPQPVHALFGRVWVGCKFLPVREEPNPGIGVGPDGSPQVSRRHQERTHGSELAVRRRPGPRRLSWLSRRPPHLLSVGEGGPAAQAAPVQGRRRSATLPTTPPRVHFDFAAAHAETAWWLWPPIRCSTAATAWTRNGSDCLPTTPRAIAMGTLALMPPTTSGRVSRSVKTALHRAPAKHHYP